MTKPKSPLSLMDELNALGLAVQPVSTGPSDPPVLNTGDLVVFRPPLPRCQYQSGTFLGAKDHMGRVICAIRLPSGLEICVDLSRVKKAGWLESLAMQAEPQ